MTVNEKETERHGFFTYCRGSDGEWYVKEQEAAYGSGYKYSDGTRVAESSAKSYKWFKVEPIYWRVLAKDFDHDKNAGTPGAKFLFAEDIVDRVKYYDNRNERNVDGKEIYPNNYKHSKMRAFLNGLDYQKKLESQAQTTNAYYKGNGFLQNAFTEARQNQILETTVDNSERSTFPATNPVSNPGDNYEYVMELHDGGKNPNACEDTRDKIFLLSLQEASTADYGFEKFNAYGPGNERVRKATDFAKACQAYQDASNTAGGWWWLRSPEWEPFCDADAKLILSGGNLRSNYRRVTTIAPGVVPALCVSN